MRLPHFEYVAPRTLDEACSLLAMAPRRGVSPCGWHRLARQDEAAKEHPSVRD